MSDYKKPDFGQLSEREILIVVATDMTTIQERLNDHGKRIRVLEGVAKTATGAIAIIGIVGGWFRIQASIK